MVLRDDLDDDDEWAAREAAVDAINDIRRGAYDDAITTLERAFMPKWMSKSECEDAYREAVAP